MTDNKTVLQALALINDCNKYKMDLTTNGVIITDAIKFVHTNREKLTTAMFVKENNGTKESNEPNYDEDKDQLEEEQDQEEGIGEIDQAATTNQVF
jgi:hypothetical protein